MKTITALASLLTLVFLLFLNDLNAQSFSTSELIGATLTSPTSLQFGPDGRLYVAQEDGLIKIFDVVQIPSGDYVVVGTEIVDAVQKIQNHNDDGTLHAVEQRLVTGLLVKGTATNPILYVTSSDYRIGGGASGADVNLDTNSGAISRLTKDGSGWSRVELVRGIARSEQNHVTNGLQLDENLNVLYVANGGHTNAGAPSASFLYICEYALSGAILKIDLNVLDTMPVLVDSISGDQYIYDLPTVDDPTRPNIGGQDINDPFGGNDGLNMARIVPGGPVEIYSPGYRNPYDVLLTETGRLYTWDNGANKGWGGHPASEGVGTATNDYIIGEPGSSSPGPNDDIVNNLDGLHLVTGPGYYGGHPNPIRANPLGAGLYTADSSSAIWRTAIDGNPLTGLPIDWPPLPLSMANPIEGDFQNPGIDDPSIYQNDESTNGIAEYRASNFGGSMQGDLLAIAFDGELLHVNLNDTGGIDSPSDVVILGSGFGAFPVDLTAQGDDEIFPGSIWVSVLAGSKIVVFTPNDSLGCTGLYDYTIDDDADGFSNADEMDNGTNPCNASSLPEDFDGTLISGFLVSNLNDPDDDDDGLNDFVDPFPWDAQNGLGTSLPIDYPMLNNDPGFGFYGLGFTGLMINGTHDYLDLIADENNSGTEIIAGGASGLFTQNFVAAGTAVKNANTQRNAFQFGFNSDTSMAPYMAEVLVKGPVFTSTPDNYQFNGFYLGTGEQDNYFKVVVFANFGSPAIFVVREKSSIISFKKVSIPGLADSASIRLAIKVDPAASTLQPMVGFGDGELGPLFGPVEIFGKLKQAITKPDQALALGVIASSFGSDPDFSATWDNISVVTTSDQFPPATEKAGEMLSSEILVYPNPFSEEIQVVTTAGEFNSVAIVDLNGRELWRGEVDQSGTTTIRPGLTDVKGMYFLQLQGSGEALVLPLIKE